MHCSRLGRYALRASLAWLLLTILLVLPLRWIAPWSSSVILQTQWLNWTTVHYQWVDWEQIAPHMALAVLAAEDQKFPQHWGFDFSAIFQAFQHNADGKTLRGGSTISQQVAKNLYLWQGRSWLRKGLEAWFTLWIELLWPKQRILEVYLNIAELGPDTFGVQAASQRYWKKSALQLTAQQAALLAAILPNPQRWSAAKPSPYMRQRQSWILRQMRQLGGVEVLKSL